jgi:2-polyprenyl-6-methoxyphenol hydroxylase-like FAD-dependent oxidoreductase
MGRSILVVGGGIGGMAMALSLHQSGQDVELIEADPAWNALGAGLTLNGGALRALAQLGMLGPVLDAGFASVGQCGLAMRRAISCPKGPPHRCLAKASRTWAASCVRVCMA